MIILCKETTSIQRSCFPMNFRSLAPTQTASAVPGQDSVSLDAFLTPLSSSLSSFFSTFLLVSDFSLHSPSFTLFIPSPSHSLFLILHSSVPIKQPALDIAAFRSHPCMPVPKTAIHQRLSLLQSSQNIVVFRSDEKNESDRHKMRPFRLPCFSSVSMCQTM